MTRFLQPISPIHPFITIILTTLMLLANTPLDAKEPLHLYIDADRSGTRASGIAIEQGVRTALSEVNNQLDGRPVSVVIRNHRGNSTRSKVHLEEYLNDKNALAVFSGLHSPPLLAHRQFINENKILVLDPWAAAGPITRAKTTENWIFRLSIDDSKAGYVIAEHAVKKENFRKPYLLLEKTGWGKSNNKTMTTALKQMDLEPTGVAWFNWNLGDNEARIILRKIQQSDADVIFFVGNAPEAKTFINALLNLQYSLPIRSHWGITGGDFAQSIDNDMRKKLDLAFIQTRFSFINHHEQPMARKVLKQAQKLFPDTIQDAYDIKAPSGFIHAYDLTRLLISAVQQNGLSGDIERDRLAIHQALENLRQPVTGLIKTYQRPFTAYTPSLPDAHEALRKEDFVMARYGIKNEIILEQ